MTSHDTIYITYAYVIPAIAALLAITLLACLLGWRKAERYIKIINDNIRIQSALAEFNKALREETDAWRELESEG